MHETAAALDDRQAAPVLWYGSFCPPRPENGRTALHPLSPFAVHRREQEARKPTGSYWAEKRSVSNRPKAGAHDLYRNCRLLPFVKRWARVMVVRMTFIVEDVIGWIEDRFGPTAAWIVSVLAVLAPTVGVIAVAVYLIR
uniref:hypothetical protein n=1 Tax=uncultured Sphingomonas sp. TaxID=158754 RepID=UPI0035CC35E3